MPRPDGNSLFNNIGDIMKSKIYIIGSMLIFGSIGLFVREIPLASAQIALIRGIIGSLFLILSGIVTGKKPSLTAIKPNLLYLLIAGAAIGFNWILIFEAYRYTSITNAILCYYFAPVFVVFLSPFVLKERLTGGKILCILGAMAGMFLVAWPGKDSSFSSRELIGIGFGLSAAILYAVVIIMNKFMKNMTGLESTTVQISTASLVLIPYVLSKGPIPLGILDGRALSFMLLLGLMNTGVAYLLYFTSMQKLNGQTVAIFSYIDPISAILMSAIFAGEKLTGLQLLGGALILGGTYFSGRVKDQSISSRK